MRLGICVDGRVLSYNAHLYEFKLDRSVVAYEQVRALDEHADIHWLANEQHDWFVHIKSEDLEHCHSKALRHLGRSEYDGMTPEEIVQTDAARNDSVLAGKIVDADPALVQAVMAQLEAAGYAPGGALAPAATNPLAASNLPQGMEALSQLERRQGDRKMTPLEARLMKKILKNDDKAKARREKDEAELMSKEAEENKRLETEEPDRVDPRKTQRNIKLNKKSARAQRSKQALDAKHAEREKLIKGQATPDTEFIPTRQEHARQGFTAQTSQSAPMQPSGSGAVQYYDSNGNPIQAEADAHSPSKTQYAGYYDAATQELEKMRKRNYDENAALVSTNVPGMQGAGKQKSGGSINGVEVNPDGTPKESRFDKFVGGIGKVAKAVGSLGGGGAGMGGGGMGGGMGGGGGGMGGGGGGGGGMGGGMGGGGGGMH